MALGLHDGHLAAFSIPSPLEGFGCHIKVASRKEREPYVGETDGVPSALSDEGPAIAQNTDNKVLLSDNVCNEIENVTNSNNNLENDFNEESDKGKGKQ